MIDYVTAPGVDVYSSIPGDSYDYYSGTSMATPHVAGAAALLRGYDPSLQVESIEDLLTGTASNNISDSSMSNHSNTNSAYDEIINYRGYITSDTISEFNPEELSGTLIGRTSNGCRSWDSPETDNMTISPNYEFETLTSNLYALSSDGSRFTLFRFLEQNHFHYFEVEQFGQLYESISVRLNSKLILALLVASSKNVKPIIQSRRNESALPCNSPKRSCRYVTLRSLILAVRLMPTCKGKINPLLSFSC